MDCPECEMCCALGLCCPPASAAQVTAMTSAIVKDGKYDEPLARKIAEAWVAEHFSDPYIHERHARLVARVDRIVAEHGR